MCPLCFGDRLQNKPAQDLRRHLQVRIGDVAVWVVVRDQPGLDLGRPLEPPHDWRQLLLAGEPHAASALAGCIKGSEVRGLARD